jgi:hypothetical protein
MQGSLTVHTRHGRGTLLLADISGYTAFLQAVAQAHAADLAVGTFVPEAYPLLTSLLDGIVERVAPPFVLSEIEGDAVFAFAAGRPRWEWPASSRGGARRWSAPSGASPPTSCWPSRRGRRALPILPRRTWPPTGLALADPIDP